MIRLFKRKNEYDVEMDDARYNFLYNVLPESDFGDVILAKRYDFENEKEKFKSGHDIGLFVVVGRDKDILICCYCTSVENKKKFFALAEGYKLFNEKKTFATVFNIKTIDENSYIRRVGKLNQDDKERLIKNLKFHNRTYTDLGKRKTLELMYNPKISIRDVVKKNHNCYLVLDVVDNKLILLKLNNYDTNISVIDFTKVTFDYNDVILSDRNSYSYVNTISKKQYVAIAKGYCIYKRRIEEVKNANDKRFLKRGFVINYNGKYYYVFNINGSVANTFEIVPNDGKNTFLVINNIHFTPSYGNILNINIKDDKYRVITALDDSKMDKINEARKKYLKTVKAGNNNMHKIHTFDIGDIVENTENYGMKYIVIGIYEDIIITISLYHFIKDNQIIYREFSNYNESLSLSKNIDEDILLEVKEKIEYFTNLGENVKVKKRDKGSK